MKHIIVALAAGGLALTGPAASADQGNAQAQRRQPANVQLTVTDATGRATTAASLPPQERQRVTSLQSSLQQWGTQQSQRASVTIHCTYPPLRCEVTISF